MTDQIDAGEPVAEHEALSQDIADTNQSGEDAAAAAEQPEGQGEAPEPPKKPSAQDRIDEVTRLRREAERERDYWREQAMKGPQAQPEAPAAKQEDAEPDPDDFTYGETDKDYIKALGAYTARQEFARLQRETEQKREVQTVEQTWAERQQAFSKDKADFREVVYERAWDCTPAMSEAIKTSDDGAAVAYHLASNPDEARRIAALPTLAQVREIGRIEARLSAPAAPAPIPTKTVSDAPAPAPQVRGQNGQFKVAADTSDFAAFEKTYRLGG